jgi:hypothetical protein
MNAITERSLDLFLAYADDAGNWNGEPLVGNVSLDSPAEDRGNLTQLKTAGLLYTFRDAGQVWVIFTDAGRALATEHGIELPPPSFTSWLNE